MAGIGVDDVAAFDLYSCFPVAVSIALESMGVAEDDPRGPTVTGGLAYAGGPANNYSLHGVAAMTQLLREQPGAAGICSGLGWFVTKHSYGVYASRPPEGELVAPDAGAVQRAIDAAASPVPIATDAAGPARVLGYTVAYEPDGSPGWGLAIAELPDGARCWTFLEPDAALLDELTRREAVGMNGTITTNADGLNEFHPRR